MALSDQLIKLGTQAKSLEDSASQLHAKNQAAVQARLAELRVSLDDAQVKLAAEGSEVSAGWADLQKSVQDGFASVRKDADARRTARKVKRADRAADNAELDAADAIDFAVYALQEAEYYVLTAAQARADATEVELDAMAADQS